MDLIATVLVVLVALLHAYFLVLEMFLWTRPLGLKTFRNTPAHAQATRVLAANQGLYNGFLAAGLLYAAASGARPFVLFFLMHLVASALQKEKFSPTNTILPDILPSFDFLFLYQAVLLVLGCAAFIFFARRRLLQ